MKYLLFVSVLFCGFCVADYLTPVECVNCIPAQAPAINPHTDLRACQKAPLIVEGRVDVDAQRIEAVRSPWFPGKNMLQRIRNRRGKD